MIAGVGIDMIEVERVASKLNKENGFKEKIFHANEILYCETKTNVMQHYAARFAVKEAFLKAVGKGLLLGFQLSDIEVYQNENGKPLLKLHGKYNDLAIENRWSKIHVSITHLEKIASAIVIIE